MKFVRLGKTTMVYTKNNETIEKEKKIINKEVYQKIQKLLKGKEGQNINATWENGKITDVTIPEKKPFKKGGGNYQGKANFDSQCAVKTAGNALKGIDGVTVENYEEIFRNLINVGLNLIVGNNKSNSPTDDWGSGTEENFGGGDEEPNFGNEE